MINSEKEWDFMDAINNYLEEDNINEIYKYRELSDTLKLLNNNLQ